MLGSVLLRLFQIVFGSVCYIIDILLKGRSRLSFLRVITIKPLEIFTLFSESLSELSECNKTKKSSVRDNKKILVIIYSYVQRKRSTTKR